MKTEVLSAETGGTVDRAVDLLRQSEVVALPTETVYGLAADARRDEAVLKIFQAKDRPRFDPLIVHLPDVAWVERIAKVDQATNALFVELHKHLWPGPLTFIFPRISSVSDVVTAGLETVAIRVSAHPIFSQVIKSFGGPLAASSANRFGRISPTTAADVVDELEGLVPLVVDGGPTAHGLESTIIALRNDRIEILRQGPITAEQLAEFGVVSFVGAKSRPEAPGQLPSHYAPRTQMILMDVASTFEVPRNKRCGLLAWRTRASEAFAEIRQLSEKGDLVEAARNLFRQLRELDHAGLDLIVAETVPEHGLGTAINDRLRRAASSA